MKKKPVRIISLILAIVMVVAMLPLSALAEETPKQKVALVVYGAEFTQMIAKSNSLDDLKQLAEDFVAEGITVPTLKATLTGKNELAGQTFTFEEATEPVDRNLFSSLQTNIPVVDKVKKDLNEKGDRIFAKVAEIDKWNLLGSLKEKYETFKADSISSTQNTVSKVMDGVFSNLQVYGSVYRVYVAEVPAGTYDLYVDEFGKDDGSVQAGYILFDDENSDFFSERTYKDVTVELAEDGRTQYLGNQNVGLKGEIKGLEYINKFNKLVSENELIKKALELLKIEVKEIDTSFSFIFPGLWTAESKAGFVFKNTDIVDNALMASSFMMVDREELVNLLQFIVDLGKDVIKEVMKASFNEEYEGYDNLVKLHLQLVNTEEGQVSINEEKLFEIVKVYLAVISNVELKDRLIDTDTGSLLTPFKLKVQLPAILQATADEQGLVTFNRQSNITLVWILKLLPMMQNVASSAIEQTGIAEEIPDVLKQLLDMAAEAANKADDALIEFANGLPYALAQRFGIVGPKMQDDHYIMLQVKAPTDVPQDGQTSSEYWLNPFAYTMDVKWINADWVYVTLADLGIIVPYFAEGIYDFVRNTTFEGTVDKFLSRLTNKEVTFVSDIMNEKVDIGDQMVGILTAFVGENAFGSLGLGALFGNKVDFISGLNKYLYENGKTAQNLMVYVNRQAKKAKAVYAGDLTPQPIYDGEDIVDYTYWQFYNIDKSTVTVATKLINKSTQDIASRIENPIKSSIVSKTGETVSAIVTNVGTKIEAQTAKIKAQVKEAAKSAFKQIATSALNVAKNVITNIFSNFGKLFSKSNSGMITFNA